MKPSLSTKAILALLILFIPILITFLFSYQSTKSHLERQVIDNLTVLADAHEGQVYQFLDISKRRAMDFASDGFIVEQLQEILKGKKDAKTILNNHLIKNKKSLDTTIHDVYIVSSGKIVASTDFSAIGKDMPEASYRNSGEYVAENYYMGIPSLLVSAPILSRATGKVIGILSNSISITELNRIIIGRGGAISWKMGRPKTMEAYLVNRDKYMITESHFVKEAILKQKVDTPPVAECLSSGNGIKGDYKDYRGVEVIGASVCFPSIKWVLLVEVDAEDVFEPLSELKRNALVASFIVAILIGVLFVLFSRNVVRPLREISDATKDIADGNFNISVHIRSKDEIGTLSKAFNAMTQEIEVRTNALKKSEESLINAQRIARLGNWDWDIVNNELRWSDEIYRIFGMAPQEFGATYEAFLNSVHPDDREFVKRSVDEALSQGKPYSIDHRIVLPDGTVRIVHEHAEVTFNEAGEPIQMAGTVQDVTEHKRAEAELRKLSTVIEHSVNIVFITNKDGIIEYVNPMFEQGTGWTAEEAIGKTPNILASGETTRAEYEELWGAITAGKTWRGSFKNKRKDGQPYWGNGVITPIKNEKGEITHFLAVQEDITEKMRSEERVRYLASYDELTGLFNRTRFLELLSSWIQINPDGPGVLLLLNIDEFKFINEVYGHGLGDEILHFIAGFLEGVVKEQYPKKSGEAILARMGGDEFAVFLPSFKDREGLDLCERVRVMIGDSRPVTGDLRITASAGIALYPGHSATAVGLLAKADAAIARAKEDGRNRCHIFRPEDMYLEMIHSRLTEKAAIQKALTDSRFIPWFQPILNLKDNKVHHYEALARMRDEKGNILLPKVFIDTAERFGLIGAIDRVITEKTITYQAEAGRRKRNISFGMNLSGKELGDEELLLFLKSKIAETGADPSRLIFEITETAAIHNLDMAVKFINALKTMGCRFSLDDFGVGFTSFVYLKRMQVDYLKIDGSFVMRLHESQDDQHIVKAITGVAKNMGIKTVAEFVENKETLLLLKEYGVDYAQGYLIGKPAPDLLKD